MRTTTYSKLLVNVTASIVMVVTFLLGGISVVKAQSNDDGRMITSKDRPLELSFSFSTAVGPASTWVWDPGLGINYLIRNNIRIGLEDISYASTTLLSGTRSGISFAPMIEYHYDFASSFAGVVGVGVPIQFRFGAGLSSLTGIAPFGRVGLDYNFSDVFTLGLIERIGYVSSSAYLLSSHAIPQGAMIYSTGLAFKFHI